MIDYDRKSEVYGARPCPRDGVRFQSARTETAGRLSENDIVSVQVIMDASVERK